MKTDPFLINCARYKIYKYIIMYIKCPCQPSPYEYINSNIQDFKKQ